MNNHSIESHFNIYHSASFSSHLSITMRKNKLFTEEKFKVQNRYQLQEENKLFKIQKRCVFLRCVLLSSSFKFLKSSEGVHFTVLASRVLEYCILYTVYNIYIYIYIYYRITDK